jgi:hypothetical protein
LLFVLEKGPALSDSGHKEALLQLVREEIFRSLLIDDIKVKLDTTMNDWISSSLSTTPAARPILIISALKPGFCWNKPRDGWGFLEKTGL